MRPRHLLALVLAFSGSARAASSLNVVTAVEVKDEGAAVVLQVTGSRPPNFTTFSMADPPRFVIDLSEARFQGVPEDVLVRDGVVNLVKNLSYGSDATSIARIMIAFQLDVDPPDVQATGTTLVVRIAKPAGAAAAAVATGDGARARDAEQKAQEAAAKAAAEAKGQEEAARAAAEAKAQEETARAAAEAKALEETARAAAEAKAQEETARAAAEAKAQEEAARADAAARAEEEKVEAAKEVAAAAQESRPEADAQAAEEARAAYEKERQGAVVRAEEEAQARARAEAERKAKEDADARAAAEALAATERELAATKSRTAVLDEPAPPERTSAAAEPAAAETTPAIADAPAVANASADVLDIGAPRAQLREVGFRQLPGASRVYVRTSVMPRFTIQDVGENVIRVELENTRATRRNDLRHLDTSFFPSAVAVVTPARRGASYVLDIKLRERVPYQQRIEGDMLAIDFERPAAAGALPVAGTAPAEGAERVPAALEDEAPQTAPAAN